MMAQNAAPLAKRSAPLRRWLHRFSMSSRSVCDLMSTTAICPPFPDRLPRPAHPAQCQQTGDRILLPVSVCPAPRKRHRISLRLWFRRENRQYCLRYNLWIVRDRDVDIPDSERRNRTDLRAAACSANVDLAVSDLRVLNRSRQHDKNRRYVGRRFGVPPTERCRNAHCRECQLKYALSIAML